MAAGFSNEAVARAAELNLRRVGCAYRKSNASILVM